MPGRACVHKDLALSDSTHDRQASPCLRCVNVHTSATESLAGGASSALGQVLCGCGSVFVRQCVSGGHCSVYSRRCERLAPAWFACHLCPCRCRDLHVERPTTNQTPLLVAGHGAHPLGRSAATVALQWFSCPIPSTAGTPTGLGRRSPHSCWRRSASYSRLLRGRSSCPARSPGVPVVVQAAAAAASNSYTGANLSAHRTHCYLRAL